MDLPRLSQHLFRKQDSDSLTLALKGNVSHIVRNETGTSLCYTQVTPFRMHLGKGQNPVSHIKEQFTHKATREPVNFWQKGHHKYPAYLF